MHGELGGGVRGWREGDRGGGEEGRYRDRREEDPERRQDGRRRANAGWRAPTREEAGGGRRRGPGKADAREWVKCGELPAGKVAEGERVEEGEKVQSEEGGHGMVSSGQTEREWRVGARGHEKWEEPQRAGSRGESGKARREHEGEHKESTTEQAGGGEARDD
ncbi:hypothetical protein NDU88_011381 [Pleurodeles waltl]|uniref:Uncharacterized protein n=1 Tax=Pleurodeles waltl TaxID=8319 RepID=A0AAV7S3J7_PLEWA|nr:hypothetical protein NDU88_011381 [Pleurodeles waltl]